MQLLLTGWHWGRGRGREGGGGSAYDGYKKTPASEAATISKVAGHSAGQGVQRSLTSAVKCSGSGSDRHNF